MKLYNHFVLYLVFCILSLFFVSCSGYRVTHITDSNKEKLKNKHGFYYNLPQTALKVDVIVKHTSLYKGPYADYAGKYFALSNIIKQDGEKYEITEVHVSGIPQPDRDQYYFVRNANCFKKHKHLGITYNNDGFIQGINIRQMDENTESHNANFKRKMSAMRSGSQFIFADNLGEKVDTIFEKFKTDTITIERKIFKKVAAEKSSEIKAKEAADHLIKIKENKFNLITGASEVPYTEGALKFMNEQLDREEHEYLSFAGDSSYSAIKYSFVYIPKKSDISNESALFIFSSKNGIVKNQDANTEAVTITVENKYSTKLADRFQTKLDSSRSKKNGFFYRIPDYGKVTVRKGKTTLSENELLITQFGVISHLPANVRKVKFLPALGSIKSLYY